MSMLGHNNPQVSVNSLSPEDRKKIRNTIEELNDSFTRVAAEHDLQKQALEDLHDSIGIEKKLIRRMARVYFRANYSEEQEANSTFEDFYELIIRSGSLDDDK